MSFASEAIAAYANGSPVAKGSVRALWAAVDGIIANGGKMFFSRTEAVDFTQAKLPSELARILVVNGSYLEIRGNGNSTDDPLFPGSFPYWGVLARFPLKSKVEDLAFGVGAPRLTNNAATAADALVVDVPSDFAGLGIGNTGGPYVWIRPTITNTVAGPTIQIGVGGAARTLQNEQGNTLAAGRLVPNAYHLISFDSGGAARVRGVLMTPYDASSIPGIQADIAALETIRTPIPMTAAQSVADGAVTVTTISDLWPTNSTGYEYSFVMPLGKATGVPLVVIQGGSTRTISGAAALSIQAGDRVTYTPTSGGAGTLKFVSLAPARLQAMEAAIANAPQVVQQVDATMPNRPVTTGVVIWSAWDSPGAKMLPRDIWLDKAAPAVPAAPTAEQFYIRPTLGSAKTSIVVRGVNLADALPIYSGIRYAINAGSPVALPAAAPQVAEISGLTADVAAYAQLALLNFVGAGAYSPVKNFTPVSAAAFSHALTQAATGTARGTRGFKNVIRKEANGNDHRLDLTAAGVWAGVANRQGWLQTDVEGLNGDNLYAEMQIAAGAFSGQAPSLGLGLNNTWTLGANDIETPNGCLGLLLRVFPTSWRLVNRTAAETETVLKSGSLGAVPTSMRIERQGMTVRSSVSGSLVDTYDLTALVAIINAAEGAAIFAQRPSGAVPDFKGHSFIAGKLA